MSKGFSKKKCFLLALISDGKSFVNANDPEHAKLKAKGYERITNAKRINGEFPPGINSMVDEYREQGWDVITCETAYGACGIKLSKHVSLWGKKPS